MIHQVKISNKIIEYHKTIINLQLLLLRLAVQEPDITALTVKDTINNHYSSNVDEITKWVVGKEKTLFEPLVKFAKHSDEDEKREFVDSLEADIQLLFIPRPGRLQAEFNTPWQIVIGNFMGHFYKLFGEGFPDYFFTTGLSYSRQDFISSFIEENDGLYLCAVCDTVAYRASVEHHTYTNIDHYFPKSRYPHLAIHPHNLVPICTLCNSWFKRDDDPLSEIKNIQELILPYGNQPGLSEQAILHFQKRALSNDRSKHPLEILFKRTASFSSETFISSFEKLYQIQARWNEDLEQLDQHVFRRITQFLLGDVQNGYTCNDGAWLADRLHILMGLVFTEDLGRDPFGFATTWLLHYHIACLRYSTHENPVAIHISLMEWADKQQEHIERIRKTADELSLRVPATTEADNV